MDLNPECRELGMHKRSRHVCDQETHTLSHLCQKCRYVFDNWSSTSNDYNQDHPYMEWPHWENVLAFEEAAARGCHLCILFLSQFEDFEIVDAEKATRNDRLDALSVLAQGEVMNESASRRSEDGSWSLTMTLPLADGPALAVIGMVPSFVAVNPYPQFPLSTVDKTVLGAAKAWLDYCVQYHEACNSPKDGLNPTRLIEVGTDGPRLRLSTEISESISYATLSHCWGTLKILRLTKSNLAEFQLRIPWDELCQTFQDACRVTEELGLRYIWIDSLCIIQDDPEDWNREALQMAAVYGGSSINISASKATDGSMGLFTSRNPKSVEMLQVCLDYMKWDTFPEIMNPQGEICKGTLYNCAPLFMHKRAVSESPLGRRAWVLQERILSRRSIFFSSQLFWECKEITVCETFPGWLPGTFQWTQENLQTQNNLDHWLAIVRLYTRCKLTFTKDRFIAISGIAQRLQERYDDEYVAGCWRKDLERQLTWVSTRPSARPSPARSPSWSWISTDSEVFWNSAGRKPPYLGEVLDVKIVPAGDSIFGDIQKGTLRMKCDNLIPFTLGPKPKNISGFRPIISGGRLYSLGLVFNWDYLEAVEHTGQLYLLLVHRDTATTWPWGLVLEPTSLERGQYRRLGTCDSIDTIGDEKERAKERLEFESSPYYRAPESAYAELLRDDGPGKKQFVITLI